MMRTVRCPRLLDRDTGPEAAVLSPALNLLLLTLSLQS